MIEDILGGAGFTAPLLEPFDFDFVAGAGDEPVADAIAYFRRIGPMARLLAAIESEAGRAAFLGDLAAVIADHRQGDSIVFRAAAWLVGSRG